MPRVPFDVLDVQGGCLEAVVPKPRSAPAGYTPAMYLTEWLTLRCRADWASRIAGRVVRLRFADAEDRARAIAAFGPPARLAVE